VTLKEKIAVALWELKNLDDEDWEDQDEYIQDQFLEQATVVLATVTKHFGVY
jgi:hypothetical protein